MTIGFPRDIYLKSSPYPLAYIEPKDGDYFDRSRDLDSGFALYPTRFTLYTDNEDFVIDDEDTFALYYEGPEDYLDVTYDIKVNAYDAEYGISEEATQSMKIVPLDQERIIPIQQPNYYFLPFPHLIAWFNDQYKGQYYLRMLGRVSKNCVFVTMQNNSSASELFLTRSEAEKVLDSTVSTWLSVANDVEYKAPAAPDYYVYMMVAIASGAALLVGNVGIIAYYKCKKSAE